MPNPNFEIVAKAVCRQEGIALFGKNDKKIDNYVIEHWRKRLEEILSFYK